MHDLAPCNYFFVSQAKKVFEVKWFVDVEGVKQKMAAALKGINIHGFKGYFNCWKKHLDTCIASVGEYFEGD